MHLRLESRPVGDVLLIQCHGRIVAGNEVYTLHAQVEDSFVKYGDVVLQLDQVEFIDSSGLGALVRLMQAARAKGGDLKLSGVPPKILKTLAMTNLLSQFETYESVEEAITAAYLGSRYSRGKAGDARPRMLCVCDGCGDVPAGSAVQRRIQRLDDCDHRRRPHPAQGNQGETGGDFRAHAIRAWQTDTQGVGGNRSGSLSPRFGRELRQPRSR